MSITDGPDHVSVMLPHSNILSSAGADGRVRLWKASFAGTWSALATLSAEQAPATANEEMEE